MQHVTISVKDADANIAFYTKYIGYQVQADMRDKGAPVVFLTRGEEETKLELLERKDEPYHGGGISIGLKIDDVEKTRAWFQEEGLEVSEVVWPNPVTQFFFVTAPEGFQVQLIQTAE